MREIRARADELRKTGVNGLPATPRRIKAQLAREFPDADRDLLVRASEFEGAPTGYYGLWIHLNPNILRPVIVKRPPGGAKKK